MTDPFGITESPQIDMDAYASHAAESVYSTIQSAVDGTERSRQARERRIGVSELGHCREKMRRNMLDLPLTDVRDKTAAFFGTIAGEAIEAQIQKDHPDWLTQVTTYFPLPSGGGIPGHADIVIPASAGCTVEEWEAVKEEGGSASDVFFQGVWDLKSKAELDSIRKFGPTQQQIFQIHAYAKGLIEDGTLDPSEPIVVGLVYFDRSGRDTKPHGVFFIYSDSVVDQIDEWVGDVVYAVQHGEEAPRDMPRDFCERFCEFFSVCRTQEDSDVQGLIKDPEVLNAVDLYRQANDMEREAKRLKKNAKENLVGVSGSTGEYMVREVTVEPVEIEAHTRAGYSRIDVRKLPKRKKA